MSASLGRKHLNSEWKVRNWHCSYLGSGRVCASRRNSQSKDPETRTFLECLRNSKGTSVDEMESFSNEWLDMGRDS